MKYSCTNIIVSESKTTQPATEQEGKVCVELDVSQSQQKETFVTTPANASVGRRLLGKNDVALALRKPCMYKSNTRQSSENLITLYIAGNSHFLVC